MRDAADKRFLRPARPGRIVGRGHVTGRGRSVAFMAGELLDPDSVVLAVGTATARIRSSATAATSST